MSTVTTPTNECILEATSDGQLNKNLADLVRILVGALQDGSIPVANSARLQDLTVNDIIELTKSKIDIPNIYSEIITNEEITNVIQMVTSFNMVRDTRFVQSDFVQFKVEYQGSVPYIVCHLPEDLINKDRLVQLYITTKNDEYINIIENEVLFEYSIYVDTTDPLTRYKLEIRADKIEMGNLITYDVNNYPSDPTKWGTYSTEKYIKATYLVDTNWVAIPSPVVTSLDNYDVINIQQTPIIPFNYGLTEIDPTDQPNEYINILYESVPKLIIPKSNGPITINYNLNESSPLSDNINKIDLLPRIIAQDESNEIGVPDTTNFINQLRWIVLQDSSAEEIFHNDFINLFTESDKVILQKNNPIINHLYDSIQTIKATYPTELAQELNNVFVMPANKVISQLPTDVFAFTENINPDFTNYKIVENMVSNLIEAKIATIKEGELAYASASTLIYKFEALDEYNSFNVKLYRVPDKIIEEITYEILTMTIHSNSTFLSPAVILFKALQVLSAYFINYLHEPVRIIELLESVLVAHRERMNFLSNPDWVAEQLPEITTLNISDLNNFLTENNKIINQLDRILTIHRERMNFVTTNNKIIEQDSSETLPSEILYETDSPFDGIFITDQGKKIINQLGLKVGQMIVSSGSIALLEDARNIKIVSSLASNEEMIPIYLAEGQTQRSQYEIIAKVDQRVFDIATNPYDVTVYREGFRLSRGDYYVDGTKIILKSPANEGEIIAIVSERKYAYSNMVSREELENAFKTIKATQPIITYPVVTYELSTVELKIENYDSTNVYDIDVKFDGSYRDDIAFVKNKDTIYVDIPEVIGVSRKSIDIIVSCQEVGKLKSPPTVITIQIRNLYDYSLSEQVNRIVIGPTPEAWYGLSVETFSFDERKETNSVYTENFDSTGKSVSISIEEDNFYQSNIISTDLFNGSFIDSYIGLDDISENKISLVSSDVTGSIFNYGSFTLDDIILAFENNRLWVIIDASTNNDINDEFIYSTQTLMGTKTRYAYRNMKELISKINLLPRSTDTFLLEHIDKLKNRFIKAMMIFDIELMMDYDFPNFARLDGTDIIIKDEIDIETIEYKVQDEIPFLAITINDPEIPNINNPYLNLQSNIFIPMSYSKLETYQQELPENGLQVNNIYGERIFSGTEFDHMSTNQDIVLAKMNYFKKFYMGVGYITNFKNDIMIFTEQGPQNIDSVGNEIIYPGMVRFKTDEQVLKDDIVTESRIKLFQSFIPKNGSLLSWSKKNIETLTPGSLYTSDLAIVEYSGFGTYVSDSGANVQIIEPVIRHKKIFIKDSFDITNGFVPSNEVDALDGYHVLNGNIYNTRWSNYYDVVLRPSTRAEKESELFNIWTLIRDGVGITDQRWLNITDGLIEKGQVLKDGLDIIGSNIYRDSEIINNESLNGFFIFGGVGYKPTVKLMKDVTVTQSYIDTSTDPFATELQWVYSNRTVNQFTTDPSTGATIDTDGWLNRTDIIGIDYGWENNEPYVDYHWCKSWTYTSYGSTYYVVYFYIHRVSRVRQVNTDIYFINATTFLDSTYTTDNAYHSHINNIIYKFTNTDYTDIFRVPSTGEIHLPYAADRVVFEDIVYESNGYWLTIRTPEDPATKLIRINFSGNPTTSGTYIDFKNYGPLITENEDPANLSRSRWTLTKDITYNLRGDGPILIKHISSDITDPTPIDDSGIYYWDTWNDTLYQKISKNISSKTVIIGIPEIIGVRNPYFMAINGTDGLNIRIDIVGTRITVIVYLDKIISGMTLEDFNLFKEEILHINLGISTGNPSKILKVLSNEIVAKIKTIIPDNDDFIADSAQIIFNRYSTKSGRSAQNLVFRVTNPLPLPLNINSFRFASK